MIFQPPGGASPSVSATQTIIHTFDRPGCPGAVCTGPYAGVLDKIINWLTGGVRPATPAKGTKYLKGHALALQNRTRRFPSSRLPVVPEPGDTTSLYYYCRRWPGSIATGGYAWQEVVAGTAGTVSCPPGCNLFGPYRFPYCPPIPGGR